MTLINKAENDINAAWRSFASLRTEGSSLQSNSQNAIVMGVVNVSVPVPTILVLAKSPPTSRLSLYTTQSDRQSEE